MIQLSNKIKPSQGVLDGLAVYQSLIVGSFTERQALAKTKFASYNKIGNPNFDAVKTALTAMCSGSKRCAYCEDAPADEVEHIYPKHLYPDKTFDWCNYLYACGTCNGPKNNKFAVFDVKTGSIIHLDGKNEATDGIALFINPRKENGMDFCKLNLLSFHFEITAPKGSFDYQSADYTFNTVLRLNTQREYLREARANAYGMYKMRLAYYFKNKSIVPKAQLNKMIAQLQKESHITVWKEMQRAYNKGILSKLDTELNNLFHALPEALNW